ncbi:hypothetical protein [Rhizobium sp. BR 315]|uniref:hypothetical protein n=1 Tax=Rhizobium sp. BR 315 TaxID=3040014 RepID=UPI003D329AAB
MVAGRKIIDGFGHVLWGRCQSQIANANLHSAEGRFRVNQVPGNDQLILKKGRAITDHLATIKNDQKHRRDHQDADSGECC